MSDLPPSETDSVDQWLECAFGSWIIWGISTTVVFALLTFSAAHDSGVKRLDRASAKFVCDRYEPAGRSILAYGCHWERS